uniref:Uncharacterized protein n=1 Tax=Amphimedon queenslandica TaxID=400682 RepID=A0A1X7UTQ2_AMPQE
RPLKTDHIFLLPSLFGCDSSTEDRLLYSLPEKMGGLGITNPSTTADFSYNTSRNATQYLIDAIKGLSTFSISQYSDMVSQSHTSCDACGSVFTTSHALDCKKGGLITQRHNEVGDLLYDLSSIVWTQTTKEPVVREASCDSVALIAAISSRGVWQPQLTAVFDFHVIDSDAPSNLSKSVESVLKTAEKEKKQKCNRPCESRRATFTPLCTTIDVSLGTEMNHFLKKLADKLSHKWDQHYGLTLH